MDMTRIDVNEKLFVSKDTVFVCYKNKVVAFNNAYGKWIKFSYECYDYLKKAVSLGMDKQQFINCFNDENDRIYIKKLLNRLEGIKVLNHSLEKREINNISILFTDRCNLFCTHCAANSKKIVENEELSTEQMLQILQKVIESDPKSITISGGEPLVRKDFKCLIRFIRNNSTSAIDLMTNATLITDEIAEFIAKNVDVVDISLDGYDEKSCSLIRGKGVFDKVINGIKLLQKYGIKDIALSMVDIHKSPYEQKLFKDLCN